SRDIDVKWRIVLGDVLPDPRDVIEFGLTESRRIAVDVVGGRGDIAETAPRCSEVSCKVQVDGRLGSGQAAQLRNATEAKSRSARASGTAGGVAKHYVVVHVERRHWPRSGGRCQEWQQRTRRWDHTRFEAFNFHPALERSGCTRLAREPCHGSNSCPESAGRP